MSDRRHLQYDILFYLAANEPIWSLAETARELDKHRSSVSRSIHAMHGHGLVEMTQGGWARTPKGKRRTLAAFDDLLTRVVVAARVLENLAAATRRASNSMVGWNHSDRWG